MNNKVSQLCGDYPEGYQSEEISNDPTFVFTNDPEFDALNLYDYEENTVIVNSFQECEHYVIGGWDFIPALKNETFFLNGLAIVCLLAIVIFSFKKLKIN